LEEGKVDGTDTRIGDGVGAKEGRKGAEQVGGSRDEREEKRVVCEHVTKHQAAPSQKDPFSFSKCEQKH
jgi:hypothetical protein